MSADKDTNIYGVAVVRIVDRAMLVKAPGMPTNDFTIPNTAWAELASKCAASHFRTSLFINVTSDSDPTKEIALSYHVMTDDALGYGIICGKAMARLQGHSALDELAALFKKMFVESPSKLTPKMADVYAKPAREMMVRLSGSGNSNDDKVKKVKVAVEEVKGMAMDNVERAIQRGQRIDDIVQATDDLQYQAEGFQRSSHQLSNQIWWNSMRGKLLIGGVACVFLLLVFFTFFAGEGDNKSNNFTTVNPA